jgi:repressor LexA
VFLSGDIIVAGKSMTFDHSDRQILSDKYLKYSMQEGESIVVDPNEVDKSNLVGKVVVARNSDGTTVKLLYKDETGVCFMPLNSYYQNNDEIKYPSEATILGRAVKIIKIDDI